MVHKYNRLNVSTERFICEFEMNGSVVFLAVFLTGLCYFVDGVPIYEFLETEDGVPLVYIRSKRSDAVAFSGATASGSGGGIPFDAAIIPKLARGDFSNLHFDIEPPNIPPGAQIFSRFGEGEGTSIHVSRGAQGPNGAFSATSAAADGTGRVSYSAKSAQY
ncbi:uncharacterized protein [Onthophagus taurus]|uniref:uncharacterized protein isoform X2 n=2 Tax=Onthophagus taurus TaxID=166361 RepID=UPI000C20FAEF|nr:uncharacterized protein LOC111429105 isoform X2 [Onthophagus taurus]